MNPTRKRTLFRVAIVLVVGLAVLVWTVTNRSRGVIIENHSGQTVKVLNVTLAGETKSFQDVPEGKPITETFKAGGDDLLTVEGRLADDTRIRFRGNPGGDLHFLILPGGTMIPRPKKN
ncbi:MAG TPA: hypothetical protein VH643_07000 [Gemmataceae bacterium]|jgi:hypothetical protein